MTTVCVTGAAGKVGRYTVLELLRHGYDVVAADLGPRPAFLPGEAELVYLAADLEDYGDTAEVLAGCEAVVHLANVPAPGLVPPARTFTRNTAMNANVFLAAAQLGLRRVAWASSETTLGLPFDVPPRYVPVDEDHYPLPTSTYALSKVTSETTAEHVSAWSGIPFVALRLSNVILPGAYADFPSWQDDPRARRWNLWSYIDVRDAATACRLAIEADVTGARSYVIANADTVMVAPSSELLDEVFPGVPRRREINGNVSLFSIERARAELGFEPLHTWREEVQLA
jgi:nucleoside-diphosphate-sugar epimerase